MPTDLVGLLSCTELACLLSRPLLLDILLVGLLPYMIYVIAVPLLPGATNTSVGIALIAAHTTLVVVVRFLGFSDSLIYIMPIIMAVLVIPLVIVALIKTDIHKSGRKIMGH